MFFFLFLLFLNKEEQGWFGTCYKLVYNEINKIR